MNIENHMVLPSTYDRLKEPEEKPELDWTQIREERELQKERRNENM
jgi:hypothetical protein